MLIKHSIYGCIIGTLISGLGFLASFVIGVFFLNGQYIGHYYFGAILYFPYTAFVSALIIPPMMYKVGLKNSSTKQSDMLATSVVTAFTFFFVSGLTQSLYSKGIGTFPEIMPSEGYLMVSYAIDKTLLFILSLFVMLITLFLGLGKGQQG